MPEDTWVLAVKGDNGWEVSTTHSYDAATEFCHGYEGSAFPYKCIMIEAADPTCTFNSDGLSCGYPRSEHPIQTDPFGPHTFNGRYVDA